MKSGKGGGHQPMLETRVHVSGSEEGDSRVGVPRCSEAHFPKCDIGKMDLLTPSESSEDHIPWAGPGFAHG